ncbi:MAG: sigma 54-interacting transcriptional regulator [Acidobacteriota bacterium]
MNDDRQCRGTSAGGTVLLGEGTEGRFLEEFPSLNLSDPDLDLASTVLRDSDSKQDFTFYVQADVLPRLHAWVCPRPGDRAVDFALDLVDVDGNIVAWYRGAERIYGYRSEDIVGRPASALHKGNTGYEQTDPLKRAGASGYYACEGWHIKKDGSLFWANLLSLALHDDLGHLAGFARITRDFSGRSEPAELEAGISQALPLTAQSLIAGIVSGEGTRILDANDAFLELVGYSRDDLNMNRVNWPQLTPPGYSEVDELAHEEALRFRACTPFEKEFVRKDGSRVLVLITNAVLTLLPFHWITWVQDLSVPDRPDDGRDCKATCQPITEMVGSGETMKRLNALVAVVAPTDATVLILGETGTGKELIARAIHRLSGRAHSPFISLNCAAIPTGLLESELFGYERGAFTGALSQKIGRFEMANHGTLFLDEVGDIPLELQPKLLRALQEKSFERLGGTKTILIDVRLVAATNRDLTQMMKDRLFRSDLYYRLRVFPIYTPRLADHVEDIPALVQHFVKKYAAKMGRIIERIPPTTIRALMEWSWPGNVRELENFLERSVILSPGSTLRAPLEELRQSVQATEGSFTLDKVEREHILRILRESHGVISTAALRLGLQRTTLNAMMKRLGISRNDL